MRFIKAVMPLRAGGLVGEVYRQVTRDFGLLRDPKGNSPWLVHSPHPELLAAVWMTCYETVLVDGALSRVEKEAIASTVSSTNSCPFCVEAHAFLGDVAGRAQDRAHETGLSDEPADERTRRLTAWASATRDRASDLVARPPFTEAEAPEAIGTAMMFHYVNRLVLVFQGSDGFNLGPSALRKITTPVVTWIAGRAVRRRHVPGHSLDLLPEAELPNHLGWASPSPTIAAAFARFSATVERAGEQVLTADERACLTEALADWDGSDAPLDTAWVDALVDGLDDRSRATVRLLALVAFAPYRVSEATVREFRRHHPSDRELLDAVAWAAFQTASRIGSWLVADIEAAS